MKELLSEEVLARARAVTCLVLDVDGVLTDGRIVYDEYGDELKYFDVQDGTGVVFWHRAGFRTVMITARRARSIKRRAKEMHVDVLVQKAFKKLPAFEQALKRLRISPEQVCAVGDDLLDLPVLRRAGLAVAVANAVDEVKATCHYVTAKSGGQGAVREVTELLLHAHGLWDQTLQPYLI